MRRGHIRTLAGALLVAVTPLVAGCAGTSSGLVPSASVTTAIQGWEHYFRLDWAAQTTPTGQEVGGYIYNSHGTTAVNVQILAQGIDPAGNVVSQQLGWVHGSVPALNRAWFRVAGLAPAARYRVSVWAFDFLQAPGDPLR